LAENPLLPHRKLQELYTLMQRCRTLERKHRTHRFAREAILAAAAIHLEPGDLFSAPARDRTAPELAPAPKRTATNAEPFTPRLPRLQVDAAIARGLQLSGNNSLVLTLADAGLAEPAWSEALTWAQAERLPFILLCTDPTLGRPPAKPAATVAGKALALTWPNVDRLARRLQLPTLYVDGEDAVALYRVVQESVLRARTAAGPAIIWAMTSPDASKLARSAAPTQRLRSYLAARNIPLPA
jgi:pyruvate dehydrogenase E1 component alpha subunit